MDEKPTILVIGDLRFAWAQARLPGQPGGKDVIAAVAGLVQE